MHVLNHVWYVLHSHQYSHCSHSTYLWKEGVDMFYEYMHVMASHGVNHLNVPPSDIRNIPLHVNDKIHTLDWLYQMTDAIIWAYYSIMQVSPLVKEAFLTVIMYPPH